MHFDQEMHTNLLLLLLFFVNEALSWLQPDTMRTASQSLQQPVRASCCLRLQQRRPPRVNPIKAVICPATPAARWWGGAVKPRLQETKTTVVTFWKSLRQTFANTNFDKNSTQMYLPKYKKNTNACEMNLIKYPDSWKAVCLRALQ